MPQQNGWRFTDELFKRISFKKNTRIWTKISLKFVPMGPNVMRHNDVIIKWKHIRVTGPLWGHWRIPLTKAMSRSFDVFFDLCLNKQLSKQSAGDLRRHPAHYDVTVMASIASGNGSVPSRRHNAKPVDDNPDRWYHDDVIKWKHFRVTGPLWGEFTGHRWIPHKAKWRELFLWCVLWSAPE